MKPTSWGDGPMLKVMSCLYQLPVCVIKAEDLWCHRFRNTFPLQKQEMVFIHARGDHYMPASKCNTFYLLVPQSVLIVPQSVCYVPQSVNYVPQSVKRNRNSIFLVFLVKVGIRKDGERPVEYLVQANVLPPEVVGDWSVATEDPRVWLSVDPIKKRWWSDPYPTVAPTPSAHPTPAPVPPAPVPPAPVPSTSTSSTSTSSTSTSSTSTSSTSTFSTSASSTSAPSTSSTSTTSTSSCS